MKVRKAKWFRIIRIFLWIFLAVIAILFSLILALNIPAVQTFVVSKITGKIRQKTGVEARIGSVKIAFPKTVDINDVYFQDKNADTLLYLGSMHINIDLANLLKNRIDVSSLELEDMVAHVYRNNGEDNFNFQFIIDALSPDTSQKSDTTKPGSPWMISVEDIDLKNIHATFTDAVTGMDTRIYLGDMEVSVKDFDINKKMLVLNEVTIDNSSVKLTLAKQAEGKQARPSAYDTVSVGKAIAKSPAYFLAWNMQADQLTIEKTDFQLDNNSQPKLAGRVDYRHLDVRDLNTGIRKIIIDSTGYRAEINNMSFSESCGFDLKKLTANAQFTDRKMEVKDLKIETSASIISADASLTYSDLKDFATSFGNCGVMVDLKNTLVNLQDIFYFVPALSSIKYKTGDLLISVKAEGKINDLDVENLEINLFSETELKSHARVTGLPDLAGLDFDVVIDQLSATKKDVYQMVDPAVFSGLNLPETFDLSVHARGRTDSLRADLKLNSAYGNVAAGAFYQNFGPARRDTFDINFEATNVLVGVILADTILGEAGFSGNAAGSGLSAGPFSGQASLEIQEARYNSYSYNKIKVSGQAVGKVFSVTASSTDPNLDFKLNANADLSGERQKYEALLDVSRLNLQALNFSEKNIVLSTNLRADLSYSGLENLEANLDLKDTRVMADHKIIPVDMLNIAALSAPDSFNVQINSDLVDGMIRGNTRPGNIKKILQSAFRNYFGLDSAEQQEPGGQLAFRMNVHIPQDIIDQFMPELDSLKIATLRGNYRSDNNELSFTASVPAAIYSNVHLDSLNLNINGKNKILSMEMQCAQITYNSLRFENLLMKEQIDKGAIQSEIRISDSVGNPRYLLANTIEIKNKFLKIRFRPGGLILNGRVFDVGQDEFLIRNDTLHIDFALENEQNKISINGYVDHLSGTPGLNLDLLLGINDLGSFRQYTSGTLSELSGKLNGEFSLKGTTIKPEIDGFLGFDETVFKISSLTSLLRISGQKINFSETGIHFNDFVIKDAENKELTINGDILQSDFKDLEFDLNLITRDFEPINSTEAENPLFFGKLSLDTDIKLKGDLKSPELDAGIKINGATDLTYVLPGSEIKLVTSEGVVHFLGPDETHDSLIIQGQANFIADSIMSHIAGINLSMNLQIEPEARFTLDIDPKSGDYLTISGSAKLRISADKAGKQSINGIYEVKSGVYQLSFYDLVKKTFTIRPGSTISWSGKPMDADLNITAAYTVTTPSVGLVATESSSMSDSEKAMFQQRLPYEVQLNIRGQLSQPDISFNISLPEKYLTTNPLIATRLTQLNTEEMSNELNKQVFALLVTGTFMPDNAASSTGGSPTSVATTAARNSVNGILADQMNKVSGKYIKQVDLNFGLTTFDDGTNGSSDTRTELDMQASKKFLHNRMTVEAQGSVNLEGNKSSSGSSAAHNSEEVAVTYELTKSGEYKIKAYYQTGYDLFDGVIAYSGVAVLFEREFETLKRNRKKQKVENNDKKQAGSTGEGTESKESIKDK